MKVSLSDFVNIQLIKNNEVIGEILGKGHTWQTAGLTAVRDMTGNSAVSSSYYINQMVINTNVSTVTPTNSTSSTIAIFEGSWGTGTAINNIATIEIRYSGTIYSRVTCTPFNKDTDTSLVINWRSTIGGDWGVGLNTIASWLAYNISPVNEVGSIRVVDTAVASYSQSAAYYASGSTIARWETTFTTLGGKTVDQFYLDNTQSPYANYSNIDVTNFIVPSGVDLITKWETTFSAG